MRLCGAVSAAGEAIMAMKNFPWGKLALAGGTLVGIAFTYYLRRGAGSEKNAALIPDIIEDEIDKVVDHLNRKFSKAWVTRGLDALTLATASSLSPTGKILLGILDEVEKWAAKQPTAVGTDRGAQKRQRAAEIYRDRHSVHA
jgi:hypothetical protein